jgi:hypothetical protein
MFRSDKSFSDYFSKNKRGVLILIAIALVLVILCLIPERSDEEVEYPDEEARLSAVVAEVYGVGRCELMINYTDDGEVFGVIVLCEGAESVSVRERLTDLLSSLYGIGANRISILKIRE